MDGTFNRLVVRRQVQHNLRRVREYRKLVAAHDNAGGRVGQREYKRACKWVSLTNALLASLSPAQGQFARWLYNLDNVRHTYSRNDAFAKGETELGMSEDALKRWREIIIYNASVLAALRGMIDLSCPHK